MILTPVIKKAWIRLRSVGVFYLPLSLQMSAQALIGSCAGEKLLREMEAEDVGRDAPVWVA